MRPALAVLPLMAALLTGCGFSNTATPTPETAAAIRGSVHGGQQPVAGAQVYLVAANTTGYGNASVSLLKAGSTGFSDGVGAYVLTASDGTFSISGDYSCAANTQVYLYALGGNPGAGPNGAAGFLAALGNCPVAGNFAATTPFIAVNEVSTIAAAYAIAGFATDALHVSSSGTPLAKTGIANAFANAGDLANISTGTALATTPSGNGTVPQSTINTLANILAACINSAGELSTACTTLFSNALSGGTTGTTPTDTATAAINIAHYPAANVANLYGSSAPTTPFTPTLSSQPNDFTLGLAFTGGGVNSPTAIAIDGSGNAWLANTNNSISKFNSLGAADSGSSGYTGGGLNTPKGIALDTAGNAWVVNFGTNTLSKFSSLGVAVTGSGGYTGGGLFGPQGLAFSGNGDLWIADDDFDVSEFSSGSALSGTNGDSTGGTHVPEAIAVDGAGSAWTVNGDSSLSKFASSGLVISGSSGYTGGGISAGGVTGIAIDSGGFVWISVPIAEQRGGQVLQFGCTAVRKRRLHRWWLRIIPVRSLSMAPGMSGSPITASTSASYPVLVWP